MLELSETDDEESLDNYLCMVAAISKIFSKKLKILQQKLCIAALTAEVVKGVEMVQG